MKKIHTVLIFWWLSLIWTFSTSWPRPFDDWKNVLLYSGAFLLCLYQIREGRNGYRISGHVFSLSLFLYFLASLISLWGRSSPYYEGLLAISRLIPMIALVWIFGSLGERPLKILAASSIISACLVVVLAELQTHGIRIWKFGGSFIAPIGYASYYGDLMALHVPLSLLLIYHSSRKSLKLLWGISGIVAAYGVWQSGARSSVIGLGIGIFTCFLLLCLARIVSWKKASLLMLTLFLLVPIFQSAGKPFVRAQTAWERVKPIFRVHSYQDLANLSPERWKGYAITGRMVAERPIWGWGLGSFRFIFPEYAFREADNHLSSATKWYMHPHNEILNQWVEVGTVGLVAFCLLWGGLYYYGLKVLRKSGNPTQMVQIICGLFGVTISLVSWQFNNNFLFPLSRLFIVFYVALIWREIRPHLKSFREWNVNIRPLWVGLVLSFLFLSSYHASLFALVKSGRTQSQDTRAVWREWAYRLAPGALDSLYVYAVAQMQSEPMGRGAALIEKLHRQYPFVPLVIFQKARLKIIMDQKEEAKSLLKQALANDPNFEAARKLLSTL